jgi:hypothetical protein
MSGEWSFANSYSYLSVTQDRPVQIPLGMSGALTPQN